MSEATESTRLLPPPPDTDRPLTPQELTNLDNLASSKYRAAKYIEAEQLLKKAYLLRREQLGEDNDDTLMTLNNLAAALGRQSKFEEAEEAFRKALQFRASKLGREHCDTLLTINHLGVLLKQQGKLIEAEPLLTEALNGLTKIFGVNHLCTAEASYNYAILCVQLGYRRLAYKPFENAHNGLRTSLGEEHPHTLDALQWKLKSLESLTSTNYSSSSSSTRRSMDGGRPDSSASPSSSSTTASSSLPVLTGPETLAECLASEETPIYLSQKDWQNKKSCEICSTIYTMFRREHHCRICSKSICNDCSPGKTMAFEFSKTQTVRYCTQCEQQGF